jgi:hypothetical protein
MSGLEALQSAQYVSLNEKRYALVEMDDWEIMLEWLETVEDMSIIHAALADLDAANGDREQAGFLRWDDIQEELA